MTTADPLAAFRSELRAAATRQRRSSQRRLVAAGVVALVAIIALTGVATGGVGWLTGTPAPHSVIADFGTSSPPTATATSTPRRTRRTPTASR